MMMSAILIYMIFSMLAVFYYDVTRFIIPNWLVASILAMYPAALLNTTVPVDWLMDLLGMLGVFVLGYFIFVLRVMGGGDVKLIIVLSLWVGLHKLPTFGFDFAILGGILSIVVLLARKIVPFAVKEVDKLPRILRNREPIPYGVAIAGAFLLMIFNGEIAMLDHRNFLPR